ALNRPATPWVICLTTCAFHSFDAPKSSWGSPTRTPSLPKLSSAAFRKKAVCTHALVGIQPTRRHVPPSSASCSMQTVRAPSCAARIAAVYPPGPPPRTATSQSILLLVGFRADPSEARAGRVDALEPGSRLEPLEDLTGFGQQPLACFASAEQLGVLELRDGE